MGTRPSRLTVVGLIAGGSWRQNKLKDFRRIATRYDRLGAKLLGLCLPSYCSYTAGSNKYGP